MKRLLIATAALAMLMPQAEAGPRSWMRHHPVASKLIAAGVAAGVGAAGLRHCRTGGVERCDGKYGEAWAIFGINTGANLLMIPLSEKIGGVPGDLLSYGGSALQLGHGVYEWRKGGDNAKNVDLSGVIFVHR